MTKLVWCTEIKITELILILIESVWFSVVMTIGVEEELKL